MKQKSPSKMKPMNFQN